MTHAQRHAAEIDELGRVDYFLDQLARAVERGEVPRSSYDVLAPRYLARREELVAVITGARRAVPPAGVAAPGTTAWDPTGQAPGESVAPSYAAVPAGGADWVEAVVSEKAAPRRHREPVRWTTVLLFVGAFLVIVASAIFAAAVWSSTSPVSKLGFLGALTAAFYAAGWYARTKLELRAGSAALTVVASAMLLFDCWIVIDGWNLEGLLPWGVALLLCSAVYWFTEVRLGDRFYGVAGAAAQVGWWWLMSAGLHWQTSVRVAGIAVIALLWQVVAERARNSDTFGSLASVLLWAAPPVELVAAFALAGDALLLGTSNWTLAGCAATVAACAAVVTMRTEIVPPAMRRFVAAGLQLPVFVVVLLPGDASWWAVAALVAAALVYELAAFRFGGAPFAVGGLVLELVALAGALELLHASDVLSIGIVGALALTWVLAARIGVTLAENPPAALPKMREALSASWICGYVLLVAASLMAAFGGAGPALTDVPTSASDVTLAAALLALWSIASLARRTPVFAFTTAAWSLYTLAALEAWAFPGAASAYYALALAALAAVWLFVRHPMARFYRLDETAFGWSARAFALVTLLVGLVAEIDSASGHATWAAAALAAGVALLFATDAVTGGPDASAALAGAALVLSAGIAGARAWSNPSAGALAAAGAGLLSAGVAAGVRRTWAPKAMLLAVASTGAATIACVSGVAGPVLAGALVLCAAAWAVSAYVASEAWLLVLAGFSVLAAAVVAVAGFHLTSWATVAAVGATGLALCLPALLAPTGPDGRFRRAGLALVVSGLAGLGVLAMLSWPIALSGSSIAVLPSWIRFDFQQCVVACVVAGAAGVVQAARWRFEPGLYVGWAFVLAGLLAEFGALDLGTIQPYTTAVAVYVAAMGALYASRAPERRVPLAVDVVTVVIGLGFPAIATLRAPLGMAGFESLAWAVGLSLVAIAAGIVLRVRTFLFAGAGVLVLVVGWRSITYLAQVWWLLLGLIGTAMLVIALTWERQRLVLARTQVRLRDGFEHWR